MNKFLRMALPAITTLWLGWVLYIYFSSKGHSYYAESLRSSWQNGNVHPVYFIPGVLLIFYGSVVIYQKYFREKKQLDLHLSPLDILLQFSVVFFVTALSWFGFHHLDGTAPYPNVLWHYPLLLAQLILIFLPVTALGWNILERLKFAPADLLAKTLLSLGTGALVIVQILWFLALFGHLTATWVWGVWIVIAVLCWRQMWELSRNFVQKKIHFTTPFGGPAVWLVFLLLIVLAHNVLELIRPMPIGFDDLGHYMNIPKLLAGQGALLSGLDAYGWGLLMSLGFILFQSTSLTLLLSCVGGVLTLFILYLIVRQYGTARGWEKHTSGLYGLLAATIFYTLPTVVFQSSKDMKVDLAAMFFCLLSLWLWWHVTHSGEKQKIELKLLALVGLLAGFAFTIKYTAALFIVALAGSVVLAAHRKKVNFLVPLMFFLFFSGLPFIPPGIKNLLETAESISHSLSEILNKIPALFSAFLEIAPQLIFGILLIAIIAFSILFTAQKLGLPKVSIKKIIFGELVLLYIFSTFFLPSKPSLDKDNVIQVIQNESSNIASNTIKGLPQSPQIVFDPPLAKSSPTITTNSTSTGAEGELQRYIGFDEGWMKYLKLPFTVTTNPITAGMYVDIGFLFLGIIPLLLLLYVKEKEESGCIRSDLLLMAGLYWVLWGWLAQGVIWYGYAGFIFLLLLLIETYQAMHQQRLPMPRFLITHAILLWLICVLFLRTANLPGHAIFMDPTGLAYARGILNEQGYLEKKIAHYLQVTKVINTDIATHPDRPPRIYRVGTFIKYFIDQNNKLVLDDNQLDIFGRLYQEEDMDIFLLRLKNSGFRYIILDTNTPTIDKTPDRLVTRRYEALSELMLNNPEKIQLILNTPGNGIVVGKIL